MPLKEADLKDTNTYKRASRMDLPKVASGNTKFWIYKDVELPDPSGKKQKYKAFLAFVDDNAIKKHLIAMGRKVICKGICGFKEERIAFEPSAGKVPYKVLKTSVPLLLGKAVWIPAGMEEDSGEEEIGDAVPEAPPASNGAIPAPPAPPASAEASPTPPPAPPAATQASTTPPPAPPAASQAPSTPPPAPPPPPASLSVIWGKLVKDVQAHVAAHPDRKEALFREMSAISELLKANKAGEAKPKMEHVQAMLDAPPTAPPAPPPAAPGAAGQVMARWSALVKQMQAAIAAHPEKKADLVRASAGIPDMIKVGKLDLATKLMDTVEATLKENPREREYRTRYQAIEARLAAALKDPAQDASRLRAMSAFIMEKADAGDFESALKALLKLEEALKSAPAATAQPATAREQEQDSEKTESEEEVTLVQFAKLRLQWQKAKQSVAGELTELEKLVKSEMADDPMIGNLKHLAEILKVFNEGLSDALDNLANADTPEKRRAAAEAAQKAADHYMDHIVDDELIDYVEENPFTETRISGYLLPPLSAISAALGTIGRAS